MLRATLENGWEWLVNEEYGDGWVPWSGSEEVFGGINSSMMDGDKCSRASVERPNMQRASAA